MGEASIALLLITAVQILGMPINASHFIRVELRRSSEHRYFANFMMGWNKFPMFSVLHMNQLKGDL
jgi:hypothetical protein